MGFEAVLLGSQHHFIFLLFILAMLAVLSHALTCTPRNRTITIPIRVNLIFAGGTPMFIREKSWSSSSRSDFLSSLSGIVRHSADIAMEDAFSPFSMHLTPSHHNAPCSVVELAYSYSLATPVTSEAVIELDKELSEAISRSETMFAVGTEVADAFWKTLVRYGYFKARESSLSYHLLIYSAASVAPQRGYQSEPGAPVTTLGIASEKRFAILDLGAKPYFLDDSRESTPGEVLMSSSRSRSSYAENLRTIVAGIFTPSPSGDMRRFPHEKQLLFSLRLVDVSSVIGRKAGTGGDSLGNRPIGATFNASIFVKLLEAALRYPGTADKQISVEVLTPNATEDATMAMAVTRAFSTSGLEMVLDSERLLRDIVQARTDEYGYFVDSSSRAHIPMYLFSFADDTRVTHFESKGELRAKVVGKQAVFMVENRLKDALDPHTSVSSEAAKEALKLICGLREDTLSYMNAREMKVPLLLRDTIQRNILRQEVDWSEKTAARKAVELLDFEGLDSRLIPHERGSAIAESRKTVNWTLERLYSSWDHTGTYLSSGDIANATWDLMQKSRILADRLHDEICNQPLSEEILLKAEVETELEDEDEVGDRNAGSHMRFYLKNIIFPVIIGILTGAGLHVRARGEAMRRSAGIGDIPITSPRNNMERQSPAIWFSTLTAKDKPKVN